MNEDVKRAIRTNDLRQWQVATAMGINEATLSRWLRTELPQSKKDKIMRIIENYGNQVNEHVENNQAM